MCVCRTSENFRSLILQDMYNIEIFLSPAHALLPLFFFKAKDISSLFASTCLFPLPVSIKIQRKLMSASIDQVAYLYHNKSTMERPDMKE